MDDPLAKIEIFELDRVPRRHLKEKKYEMPRCLKVPSCARDEGRPLGIGFQERMSNRLMLLWSRAMVVNDEETARQDGVR